MEFINMTNLQFIKQDEKYIKSNTNNHISPSIKIEKGSRFIPCINNKNEVGLFDNEKCVFIEFPNINGFEIVAK